MQSPPLKAVVLIAIATVLSTGASAQNTYKCGDTYSQLPCPGGIIVNTTDKRTSAQKTQSDLATARDARTAEAMEKARLQREKIDIAANTPTVKPASPDKANNTQTSQVKKKKKKEQEYFTAQIPGEKKKKQALKKNADKKGESKS